MNTATSIFLQLPAGIRPKRSQPAAGSHFLQLLDGYAANSTVKSLAWGILWADQSGRTFGTLSIELRKATPWQAARLLAALLNDGIERQNEVPGWLNAKALSILQG